MAGGGGDMTTRPLQPRSPKPRGCPPIRTIRHSSPVELVSSRSLGNLREGGAERNHPSQSPQGPGMDRPTNRWTARPVDGTYRFWVSASITMEMYPSMREKAKKVMESRSWLPAPSSLGGLQSRGGGWRERAAERGHDPQNWEEEEGLVVALSILEHCVGMLRGEQAGGEESRCYPQGLQLGQLMAWGGSGCWPCTGQG